jgi:hypothetical protein
MPIPQLTIEQQNILKKRKLGSKNGVASAAIWPTMIDLSNLVIPDIPEEPPNPDNYFKGFEDPSKLYKYLSIKNWNINYDNDTGLATGEQDFNTIEGIYGPVYTNNRLYGHITYMANGDGSVSVYESNGMYIDPLFYTPLTTIAQCEQYINIDVPGIILNDTNQTFTNSDKVYSLSHLVPGTYTPLDVMNINLTLSISNMGPFDCSGISMARNSIAFFWRGTIPYNSSTIDIQFNPRSIATNYWYIGINNSLSIFKNENALEFIPGKYPPKTSWIPYGPLASTYPNAMVTLTY